MFIQSGRYSTGLFGQHKHESVSQQSHITKTSTKLDKRTDLPSAPRPRQAIKGSEAEESHERGESDQNNSLGHWNPQHHGDILVDQTLDPRACHNHCVDIGTASPIQLARSSQILGNLQLCVRMKRSWTVCAGGIAQHSIG